LYISNDHADKDVIFQCDDGSGGLAAYITLDGSAEKINLYKSVEFTGGGFDIEPSSGGNGQLDVIRTSGAGVRIQAQSATGIIGTSTNHKLDIKTNDSTRLSISTSGVATFSNNIIIPDDGTIGSASDTDAISIDDSGVVEFSGRIKANVREFEITSTSDGDAKGDIVYFGSTTSMTAGKLYYYNSSGNWALTDADAASTSTGLLGVALGTASNTHGMLLRGMVTVNNIGGTEAVGDILYVALATGDVTKTVPSGSGDIVRVVGYCLNATNGQIWFNPDGAFVEVA